MAGASAASPVSVYTRVAARANPAVSFALLKGGQTLDSASPRAISTASSNTGNLANDAFLSAETTLGSGLGLGVRATGGNTGARPGSTGSRP